MAEYPLTNLEPASGCCLYTGDTSPSPPFTSPYLSIDRPKRYMLSIACVSSAIHHPHHHQGTYDRCVNRTTLASAQKGTGTRNTWRSPLRCQYVISTAHTIPMIVATPNLPTLLWTTTRANHPSFQRLYLSIYLSIYLSGNRQFVRIKWKYSQGERTSAFTHLPINHIDQTIKSNQINQSTKGEKERKEGRKEGKTLFQFFHLTLIKPLRVLGWSGSKLLRPPWE